MEVDGNLVRNVRSKNVVGVKPEAKSKKTSKIIIIKKMLYL